MKLLLFTVVLLTISGCTKEMKIDTVKTTPIKSFQQVWNQVVSDPLDKLPQNNVSFGKLSTANENTILNDAHRTLNNYADILEPFNKLAHPNGICFKGIWSIDIPNIYSGYFKKNSRALIIVRASTALSNTTSDDKRAFGFAGKLFPTTILDKINKEHSANFFLIDDLGGTNAIHYTDVELTNEPKVSFTYDVFKNLLYAIKVASSFSDADKHSAIRQLYEISQLGENNSKNIITPKWMKIDTKNSDKVDAKDFRDELKLNDGKKIVFNISVANKIIDNDTTKNWDKIGTITLDTSIVSNSCDHRLHFHHPKWKDNLDYGD